MARAFARGGASVSPVLRCSKLRTGLRILCQFDESRRLRQATQWSDCNVSGFPGLRTVMVLTMAGEMIIPKGRTAEDRGRVFSESERGSFPSRVASTSQDLVP